MLRQTDPAQVVFIVDDDAHVRDGLRTLLESVDLPCKVFGSTEEFLKQKAPDRVSCLVLDVRMPGLSGLDFQASLPKAYADIPIIFITGYGDVPMTVRAMKAGAVEFLTKPLREQDVLDAIHLALARDRSRRDISEKLRELRERFASLSDREREVLSLVIAGLLNKQIAGEMKLSEVTVKVHRHNVMKKLGAKSVPALVRMAETLGVPPGNGHAA
jgi:FixJ family two-component response regulator